MKTTIVPRWVIGTIAGTGEPGFSGDGGLSAQACLNEPKGVAIGGDGHLYIADSENHVIRKVDRTNGLISTVAGMAENESSSRIGSGEAVISSAEEDPLGDGAGRSPGPGYRQQADVSGTVRYWANGTTAVCRYSGDGGFARNARLNFPTAVVINRQGTLYIADTMNHRVRVVDAATGLISTLAGTGQTRFTGDGGPAQQAALNEPAALALDEKGNLYIADQGNHRIRMIEAETGVIRTVAGTGTATYDGDGKSAQAASLAGPSGLIRDGDRLYIADTFNGRIRCLHLSSGMISTVAGDGAPYRYESPSEALVPSLSRPTGIAVDREGHLFLTDSDSHIIRRWDWDAGVACRIAGNGMAAYSGDGGLASGASLCYPFGIAVDHDGTIFVADTFNHCIRALSLEQG